MTPDADEPTAAPRKTVARLRRTDPLRTLERLNSFVRHVRRNGPPPAPREQGSWPVRKRVGRAEPR